MRVPWSLVRWGAGAGSGLGPGSSLSPGFTPCPGPGGKIFAGVGGRGLILGGVWGIISSAGSVGGVGKSGSRKSGYHGDVPKWLKGLHSKSTRLLCRVDGVEPLKSKAYEVFSATIFPEMLTVC